MADMHEVKRISLQYKNLIALFNSIKSQENISDLVNCDSEEDVLNLPFMIGSRMFSNMGISDNDMGKFSPLVEVKGYPLFGNRYRNIKYNFGTTRADSCWSKYGATIEDNERTDTALFRHNSQEYIYINDGFVDKPSETISDFDRIGVFIENWSNNLRKVIIFENDYGEYFVNTDTQNTGVFKAKYIKDGNKSNWIDMFCYRSIDNLDVDYRHIGRMDVSLLTGRINSSGSPYLEATGYEWAMNNILNGAIPYFDSYSGGSVYNFDTDFTSNVWLFASESDLNNYLETGDYSNALNYNGTPKPIEEDLTTQKKYYINCDIWESSTPTDTEKNYTNKNYLEIYVNEDLNRPFSLTLNNDTQRLHLNTNDVLDEDIIKMRESDDGGETWHNVTLDSFHNDSWRYTVIKKSGNNYQGAEIYTNIPIFKNALQSALYFNNKIDEENSLNPTESIGDTIINKLVDIGKGLKIKNELNIQSVKTSMSEIVFSNDTFFDELASLFNDDSIATQIKQGLLMHSNPQDIFIDMFALPFDVAPLVINSMSRNKMDFGTYEHTFTNTYKVISKPKEITMFSTKINPIFNDWRDYQLNISLYLPYCNIIALPVEDIMNNLLTCTFIFDITSCTIKYFIKVDNITILTCEGVVRYELPLSASNNIQGFRQKLGGASQIINSSINYNNTQINTAVGTIGAALNEDWEGVANEYLNQRQSKYNLALGIAKGVIDIKRPTPKNYSGNYSSSCAFYDELNAYLIIEQANLIYSDSIKNNFNLPDNRVSTLSSCHGYTEIDYIDLQSSCTQSERDSIINLLSNGFYV